MLKSVYPDLISYSQVQNKLHCLTFKTVESTMDIANMFEHKAAYLSNNYICAFTSLEQTKGRGQG